LGTPDGLEHETIVWEAIQRAKKLFLHVVWLDLANAYGSVPHKMLWLALEMYQVPAHIRDMLKAYFNDLVLRFPTSRFTTDWTRLEIGIAMGCSISPILFVLAMQIILKAAENAANGPDLWEGCNMPPLKAYRNDTTVLTTGVEAARTILARLDEMVE
jgi:hypothetical protein